MDLPKNKLKPNRLINWLISQQMLLWIIILTHHCVVNFSGPQGSWSVHVCCLHLKMEFCSCARGRQWCGIIHYHWWAASMGPRLLFSRTGYASWGLSFSSVYYEYVLRYKTIFSYEDFKQKNDFYLLSDGFVYQKKVPDGSFGQVLVT